MFKSTKSRLPPSERRSRLFVIPLLVTLLATASGASPSSAMGATLNPEPSTTGATITAARTELLNSTLPRVRERVDGITVDTFTFPGGSAISISAPAFGVRPRLSAGIDGSIFVQLNKTDQSALIAGGTIALTAALCAIPAVGWAACGAIGTALGIAATYLTAHGLCRGTTPNLRIYITSGYPTKCVQ